MTVQDLSHRRAWDLIPLVINGTSSGPDREFVDAHLQDCADCRDEYAFQLRLRAGMHALDSDPADPMDDALPAMRRLFDRIDDEDRDAPPQPRARLAGARRPRSGRPSKVLGAAVVAQACALALLGVSLLDRPVPPAAAPAAYETLSSGVQPAAATIRLVPSPSLPLSSLQALLSDNGLRVVEVSEDGSIYSLAPVSGSADPATRQDVLARLRADAGVLLAEPVGPDAR